MTRPTFIPEPELLSRADREPGKWTVDAVAPKRGLPSTSIVDRHMRVPVDASDMSRVIRAHEMMHGKVSPSDQFDDWIARGVATRESMVAVEELRVNLLCQKAGFDMKKHLSDDGETADGERIAVLKDWKSAVHMAIACAGTASSKKFLTGIRRHNREWGNALKKISDRAEKAMEKAYRTGWLHSTEVHPDSGLAPMGFFHTEAIAEWLDRIAGMSPPDDSDDTTDGKDRPSERKWEEEIERFDPAPADAERPVWEKLHLEKCRLTEHVPGALGKKRIASPTGRYPRRMHRLLTDPERRVFDRITKGDGGMVVIDCSGSMHLENTDIRQLMEIAPGCTIVCYSHCGSGEPNAYIVADKGKMTSSLPHLGRANGVDGPVLEWAIANRNNSRSPIIWVCDGAVTGTSDMAHASLSRQVKALIRKHNIVVAHDVDDGKKALRDIAHGRKPVSSKRSLDTLDRFCSRTY